MAEQIRLIQALEDSFLDFGLQEYDENHNPRFTFEVHRPNTDEKEVIDYVLSRLLSDFTISGVVNNPLYPVINNVFQHTFIFAAKDSKNGKTVSLQNMPFGAITINNMYVGFPKETVDRALKEYKEHYHSKNKGVFFLLKKKKYPGLSKLYWSALHEFYHIISLHGRPYVMGTLVSSAEEICKRHNVSTSDPRVVSMFGYIAMLATEIEVYNLGKALGHEFPEEETFLNYVRVNSIFGEKLLDKNDGVYDAFRKMFEYYIKNIKKFNPPKVMSSCSHGCRMSGGGKQSLRDYVDRAKDNKQSDKKRQGKRDGRGGQGKKDGQRKHRSNGGRGDKSDKEKNKPNNKQGNDGKQGQGKPKNEQGGRSNQNTSDIDDAGYFGEAIRDDAVKIAEAVRKYIQMKQEERERQQQKLAGSAAGSGKELINRVYNASMQAQKAFEELKTRLAGYIGYIPGSQRVTRKLTRRAHSNYRYASQVLPPGHTVPLERKKANIVSNMIIVIDTSVSMDSYTLRQVFEIINSSLPTDVQDVVIVQADTKVQKVDKYRRQSLNSLTDIEVYGRGGTDMIKVLKELPDKLKKEVRIQMNNTNVLIITDGYWFNYKMREDESPFQSVGVLLVSCGYEPASANDFPKFMKVYTAPPLNPYYYLLDD